MNEIDLPETARALTAPGKGILAADESAPTIAQRFSAIGLESTEATRRAWRELLFTTPDLGRYISGGILFDETLRQRTEAGARFPDLLVAQGIVPGIKVDRGLHPLPGFPGDTVTEGLDGLGPRLEEYRALGARFAKWRAVTQLGDGLPEPVGIEANAHLLARYAATAQEAGLVPIVEPEVLMTGAHSIERCEQVTADVLQAVFEQLFDQRVLLEGMVLKPNLVVAGSECAEQPDPATIAEATLRCLRRHVPAAVPGIAFLSGGLSETAATLALAAVNELAARTGGTPWELSFSFGRALQHSALRTWKGSPSNVHAAQSVLLDRARLAALARSTTLSNR
jgi:fructose-bisphosphate aldolase class I